MSERGSRERSRGREDEGRKKFVYKKRDDGEVTRRAEKKGGLRDGYIKDGLPFFKPKEGTNTIRIMPPTWDDPLHYGFDVVVHNNIGADNSAYLCLRGMKKDDNCCLCEERNQAANEKDEAYAKALKPQERVVVWLIDRDNEKDGPKLWSMPFTVDKDISIGRRDKRGGTVLQIDNPDDGYDVEFTYAAPTKTAPGKFSGIIVARRDSSLSDDTKQLDAWLDYVANNPIPDCLNYFDNDYISKVYAGKGDEEKSEKTDKGSRAESSKSDKPTWDDIQNMKLKNLEDLAIDELKFSEREVTRMTEEDLRDEVCKELDLKAPSKSEDADEKLKGLRNRARD